MLRPFLTSALIAPVLLAQTPEQRLTAAWAGYTGFDLIGDPDKGPEPGFPAVMDELGRAWAAWVERNGPVLAPLPGPMNFRRSNQPDTLTPPVNRVLAHRGPWTLVGLKVPAPCGSHLFIALLNANGAKWRLTMIDLHEPRDEQDPMGARDNAQALLLDGPRIVIASTPPWCTSCWSNLHVRVLAPGADTDHPKLLVRFEDTIYRCADEDMLRITPVRDGVRLAYEGMASLDGATTLQKRFLSIPEK